MGKKNKPGFANALDIWDAGGSNDYLYTENRIIADLLKRDFKRYGIYLRGNKIIAWQFYIPKRIANILILRTKQLNESETSKINNLA